MISQYELRCCFLMFVSARCWQSGSTSVIFIFVTLRVKRVPASPSPSPEARVGWNSQTTLQSAVPVGLVSGGWQSPQFAMLCCWSNAVLLRTEVLQAGNGPRRYKDRGIVAGTWFSQCTFGTVGLQEVWLSVQPQILPHRSSCKFKQKSVQPSSSFLRDKFYPRSYQFSLGIKSFFSFNRASHKNVLKTVQQTCRWKWFSDLSFLEEKQRMPWNSLSGLKS